MSATLLAVVIALVLGHTIHSIRELRNIDWYLAWNEWLGQHRSQRSGWGFALVLLPPLVLVALLQWWLGAVWLGLPGFVFALAVLLYCWGPRDLDVDVEAVVDATDPVAREAALRRLGVVAPGGAADPHELVGAVFQGALRRWFGVLLWFLVLGPVGALAYRLLVISAEGPGLAHLQGRERDVAAWLLRVADWPVAQLMTLGLALVGDLDRVLGSWRDWHASGASLDPGFVLAAGRACVDAELEDEPTEMLDNGVPQDFGPGISALRDAMSLVWRILLLWLAVLALFVLAGFVN
jgi:AmpE protein